MSAEASITRIIKCTLLKADGSTEELNSEHVLAVHAEACTVDLKREDGKPGIRRIIGIPLEVVLEPTGLLTR